MTLKRWNPNRKQPDSAANTTRSCDNCGAHVTANYYRVFAVDGDLHCCPECEGLTRGNDGRAREMRSAGGSARGGQA